MPGKGYGYTKTNVSPIAPKANICGGFNREEKGQAMVIGRERGKPS
jgi:hypothetical protein